MAVESFFAKAIGESFFVVVAERRHADGFKAGRETDDGFSDPLVDRAMRASIHDGFGATLWRRQTGLLH